MKQELMVHIIRINRKGQQVFFDMQLPRDARRITGIETGCSIGDGVFFTDTTIPGAWLGIKPNVILGSIKLKEPDKEGICYEQQLVLQDNNTSQDSYSFNWFDETANQLVEQYFWQETPQTHGTKREEDMLSIPCNTRVLKGFYKDMLGEKQQTDIRYRALLYVWYETENR